ncbi:MAG: protein kinase, partial [Acidobacteria bacterium]|nr:protein kinase [Acidobacteriota bacterium]
MASQSLAPGSSVSHYRIASRLGGGGMGEVYLARDTHLDRDVALKILPTDLAASPDRLRRFVLEARAASALSHPNVAHIYEIGESDGLHFIAMEYVEGKTLSAHAAGKPMAVAELLDLAAQAADALDESHAKGVVHRDIKPANVMITPRGQVKVLDFGLAKIAAPVSGEAETQAETLTNPGVVMGTMQYMSPEQAMGRPVDHRADLFSLGVVLYEMIAARPPFSGATATETIHKITSEQPEAIARFNYDCPAELERIIRKCLEKDRERRYQSARELVIDLRNLQRDSGSHVRVSSIGTAALPAPPRPRWRIPAAAAGVLALAALGYLLLRDRGSSYDSVAVLPFANAGGDANLDYLSDGLTEQLINSLTQIPKLRVIARATVFTYKGKPADPREVGKKLGVRAILMGKVTQRGDGLEVQVDLVDSSDGSQLWGQRYSRRASEAQDIERAVANEVAGKLRLPLSAQEQQRLSKPRTVDPEAYRLYLRGRYLIEGAAPDRLEAAISYLRKAIDRDSKYAQAYAGLADAYSYQGHLEYKSPKEAFPKAKAEALRALEIDDSVGEAHTALGLVKFLYDWDFPGAEREFIRGKDLNPGNAYSLHWHAHYLEAMGRMTEAATEMNRSREMDPLSSMLLLDSALQQAYFRRWDKALQMLDRISELEPGFPFADMARGSVFLGMGRGKEALAALDKAKAAASGVPFAMGLL